MPVSPMPTPRITRIRIRLPSLQNQVAICKRTKMRLPRCPSRWKMKCAADLESKDVTISKLQGKLTVNILDRVLFDSGEAILKPDGRNGVAKNCRAAGGASHVEDSRHWPHRQRAHPQPVCQQLGASTARALAAVHFFTEKAGVDPRRVGAVGYGEYRPIADNSTPEGRAKNRRIAITILPDELAGADTVTAPKPDAAPNPKNPPNPNIPPTPDPH